MTGWFLGEAIGISDDGMTMAGWGTHNGNSEAWVANLGGEPIPEPATIALLGIGPVGLGGMYIRRRFRQKQMARAYC